MVSRSEIVDAESTKRGTPYDDVHLTQKPEVFRFREAECVVQIRRVAEDVPSGFAQRNRRCLIDETRNSVQLAKRDVCTFSSVGRATDS